VKVAQQTVIVERPAAHDGRHAPVVAVCRFALSGDGDRVRCAEFTFHIELEHVPQDISAIPFAPS